MSVRDLNVDSARRRWNPHQSLPREQQTVLVLPRNPNQSQMDKLDIHFSVQWELERQVARQSDLSWEHIRLADLELLKGGSFQAIPKIEGVLALVRARTTSAAVNNPRQLVAAELTITRRMRMLTEMDLEEESIRQNDNRGVGTDNAAWTHGGKISYIIIVRPASILNNRCVSLADTSPSNSSDGNPFNVLDGPSPDRLNFTMSLCPPEMPGKSFRLARRFGSRRVISFKLKEFTSASQKAELMKLFIGRKLLLFGRIYRALWAPPDRDSVFVVETNETSKLSRDPPMPSFLEILDSRLNTFTRSLADNSVQRYGSKAFPSHGQVRIQT